MIYLTHWTARCKHFCIISVSNVTYFFAVCCSLNLDEWLSRDRWSSESSSSGEEGEPVFAAPQPDPRPTAQFTPEELHMVWNL